MKKLKKKKRIELIIPIEPVEYSLGHAGNHIFAHHKKDKIFAKDWLESAIPPDFKLIGGPVALSVKFYLSPRKEQFMACRQTGDPYIEAPDLSNLTKFIEDVMTDIIYKDDRQIVKYIEPFYKEYDKEDPRTEIIVYELC